MRDLAEESGLPKTTIHHYIREGLLPPARKSSRNAALYGSEHLERLRLIGELRDEAAGELSIPQVRTVLAYMADGMPAGSAARLAVAGIQPTGPMWSTPAELSAAAGVDPELIRTIEAVQLIRRADADSYSAGDLLLARACDVLVGDLGVDPGDLTPLADLIREVGDYAESLAELYATEAEVGSADAGNMRAAMRDGIRGLLDALLWRSLET
ncbi:MAG: MerR family transcriptional regulator [Gemmatimonadota bacterium]